MQAPIFQSVWLQAQPRLPCTYYRYRVDIVQIGRNRVFKSFERPRGNVQGPIASSVCLMVEGCWV
jgi:hypothetical protein